KHPWNWTPEYQQAFNILKETLANASDLFLPQDHGKWCLEMNASDYALGAILYQYQEYPNHSLISHPVAYLSKTMLPAECNYPIYDKEMLAIMTALKEWRHFLIGTEELFEIWSDHDNIKHYHQPQDLNRRQAQWVTTMAKYNFTLHHLAGKLNIAADTLSCHADHFLLQPENQQANPLRSTLESLPAIPPTIINIKELIEKVIQAQATHPTPTKGCTLQNGVWFTNLGQYWVSQDPVLKGQIIFNTHDHPLGGHPGHKTTLTNIKKTFFWPGLDRQLSEYCKACIRCQELKNFPPQNRATLHPHNIPQEPWEVILIDVVGPLPESNSSNAILNIVDHFSKYLISTPVTVNLTSKQMAEIYRDKVFSIFSIPKKIVSDRGTQFASHFMNNIFTVCKITPNCSTAYHPQTNGQVERINAEITKYLRLYSNHAQNDWAEWLPVA
ncbi:hypothetical protein AX16_009165, partial [Volvariella volvacea WC 439]